MKIRIDKLLGLILSGKLELFTIGELKKIQKEASRNGRYLKEMVGRENEDKTTQN